MRNSRAGGVCAAQRRRVLEGAVVGAVVGACARACGRPVYLQGREAKRIQVTQLFAYLACACPRRRSECSGIVLRSARGNVRWLMKGRAVRESELVEVGAKELSSSCRESKSATGASERDARAEDLASLTGD
jgi:hypothetical protein